MTRLDLAFILCCCKACLVSNDEEESFYDLLGVDIDATQDEIKRAYKRQSLQMHPDKLAQKGQEVTEELQERFTRMKEAYDVLADSHKRETYDTIGEVGMKWIDEPFSIDPQEMAHNFSNSSTVDRSKIFAIFVALAVIIFIIPILVCLQIDGKFGPNCKWVTMLTPLWIYNALALLYHIRVVMMGPIPKPDHIPEDDWIDPLPLHQRVFSMFRFLLLVAFEILAALRLDGILLCKWTIVFLPLFIFEAALLCKKLPVAQTEIITEAEIEYKFGKPFTDFTQVEKDMFLSKSIVVPSKASTEFTNSDLTRSLAREDVLKLCFRLTFFVLLMVRLDTDNNWSWWVVFAPFWVLEFSLCFFNFENYQEAVSDFNEHEADNDSNNTSHYGAMEEGGDGDETMTQKVPLTEAEQEVLQNRISQSKSRLMTSCCSSIIFLILLIIIIPKTQGAEYSSMWIISPFLIIASMILCFIGCAIFGLSPEQTENIDLDDAENQLAEIFDDDGPISYDPPLNAPEPITSTNDGNTYPSTPQSLQPTVHTVETPEDIAESDKPTIFNNSASLEVVKETEVATAVAAAPQIDLLDDTPLPQTPLGNGDNLVGPTPSEVEDLD